MEENTGNRLPVRRIEDAGDYEEYYDEDSFGRKLKAVAGKLGETVLRPVLTLYYILRDGHVTMRDKAYILGALGYFILPADAIPDFIAVIGYTDDIAVILLLLRHMAGNITPEIRENVETQLDELLHGKRGQNV
ncbi:MAG: DUF1232 domain-containing protein [Tannerella sp.]|nr:DUF1232 domain-containing protein [Tannerella sp.]